MHNLEAEKELIGIVLFDDSALPLVEHVKPEHFFRPINGRIWEICLEVSRSGRKINHHLIPPLLGDSINEVGKDYLERLWDKAASSSLAGQYASAIINAWQVREIAACVNGVEKSVDAEQAMAIIRADFDRIEMVAGAGDEYVDARLAAETMFAGLVDSAETGRGLGMLCGLKCVDERLGGLQSGHLIVIGGRPAMGKTALSDCLSYGAARKNPDKTFVFFNLEMDSSELSQRQLSARAYMSGVHVQYRHLRRPTQAILDKLEPYQATMPKNLLICDRKRISVDDVRRMVWKLKAKRQVGAVFIDYLQLMQMPQSQGKNDAKIIAEATAELKRIAGDAGICIVLLSQLNRGPELRDNKRPMMSDLRDSGGVEQDANAILFPYREHYYLKNEPPKDANHTQKWKDKLTACENVMTVICAKNRGGETGDDEMYCSLGYDIVLNEPLYEVEGLGF